MKENKIGNISYINVTFTNVSISTINQSIFLFNGDTQFVEINTLQISNCSSFGDFLSFYIWNGGIDFYGSIFFENNIGKK